MTEVPDEETPQATRSTVRVPLSAEARVEFETFSGFLNEMAANLSLGGMFLRTRYLKPVGSELRFELRLADQQPLVAGRGQVAWIRWKDEGPRRRAGMGVRFVELDTASRELVYRVVDERVKAGGLPFDLDGGPSAPEAAPVPAPDDTAAAPPVAFGEAPSAALAPEAPPAAPAETEPPQTFASWQGSEPSTSSRRQLWWIAGALAAVAAVALIAAAALWRGGSPARPPQPAAASQVESQPPALAPVAQPLPIAEPIPPPVPLRRIERITWEALPGETVVWLWGDGVAAQDSYVEAQLGGGTPRAVVKLRGVRGAEALGRLEVSTPELLRIRVGEHRVAGEDELHVVLDLARPEARLRGIEIDGARLRLLVGAP
jgi:uncharacterized protein (TIGR02266 family)